MKYGLFVVAGSLLISATMFAGAPPGWHDRAFGQHSDGGAIWSANGDGYDLTVTGKGADTWGKNDEGRFVFTPLAGDCEIQATTESLAFNSDYGEWARWGLMMRGSLLHNSAHLAFYITRGTQASANRVQLTTRPSDDNDTIHWSGFNINVNTNLTDVRLRLVRQGTLFAAWLSTNGPAFNAWIKIGEQSSSIFDALNVGTVVCRHTQQTGGPDSLTRDFRKVIARSLVTAAPNGSGHIDVAWIGDPVLAEGTITGFVVSRAQAPTWSFSDVDELGASTTSFEDAGVSAGRSYRYRVEALVNVEGETKRVLVGTSVIARVPVVMSNTSPGALNGVYAEYYKPRNPRTLVTARIEPSIEDPWNNTGAAVYPPYTACDLGDRLQFEALFAGNITVPETGCYGFVQKVDDEFHMTLDGTSISKQTLWLSANEIHTVPIWLEAGRSYPFNVRYTQGAGGMFAQLKWFKGTESIATVPQSAFEPFPWPWQHRDIGDSPLFGNAFYDSTARRFMVVSSGLGIDPTTGRDDAHFAWQSHASDFDIIATVKEFNAPPLTGAGAGLAIRADSASDNAASMVLTLWTCGNTGADRELAVAYRSADNAIPQTDSFPFPLEPVELRLARRGADISAYYRTDTSGGWVGVTNFNTGWSGTLRGGMVVFSGSNTHSATGIYEKVTFAHQNLEPVTFVVADHEVTLTAPQPPMLIRQVDTLKPNVGWYWADYIDGEIAEYRVLRSNHPDQDFSVIGATPSPTFTYTDVLPNLNTLVFYKFEGVYALGDLAEGGSNSLAFATKPAGVSDGSVSGLDLGLYTTFHRGASDGNFSNTRPVHMMLRDLGTWEKGSSSSPMIAAGSSMDSTAIGPDNFQVNWAGKIIPPYTGWYWIRTQTDDACGVWINGMRAINQWGYVAAAITSEPVWLEAGVPAPVHIFFQQGTGGGYFRMWWRHGYGYDGQFTAIPKAQMQPLGGNGMATLLGHNDTFHSWRVIDINTGKNGYTTIQGSDEAFDAVVAGSGSDIWGSADGLHFIYRELAENFEIEGTLNSIVPTDGWAKAGLMVRDGLDKGARYIMVMTTPANGVRIQFRETTGAVTTGYTPTEITGASTMQTPAKLRLVKAHGKIQMFINDIAVQIPDKEVDVSDWGSDLCVGIGVTSHNNARLCPVMVNDLTFSFSYPKGTTLMLK